MSVNTETERKFLIVRPEDDYLSSLPCTRILQTYLIPEKEGMTDRVRMRGSLGNYVYTHTKKVRLSHMSSMEDETEISKEEYESLLLRANPALTPISKTRCLLKKDNLTFEIDVYPFWKKQAVMEIELPGENTEFDFPEEITLIREVTGNHDYSNYSLSKRVPEEDI